MQCILERQTPSLLAEVNRQQDQLVAGVSHFVAGNINLFGEFIRTDGWVPLNFVSGGNQPDGGTWSTQDANSEIFLVGTQVAF